MDHYFTRWRPMTGKKFMDNDQWRTKTARLRSTLHARLVRLYGTSRVPVSKLNWLIRWYAKQSVRQWQKNSELPDPGAKLRLRPATRPLLGAGLAIAAAGCPGGGHRGVPRGCRRDVPGRRPPGDGVEQDELDEIYDDEMGDWLSRAHHPDEEHPPGSSCSARTASARSRSTSTS